MIPFKKEARLFKAAYNGCTVYPDPASIFEEDTATFCKVAGQVLGLAIANRAVLDVSFSYHFLKLLLNQQPSLQDLWEIDPGMTKSLVWIQKNDVDQADLGTDLDYELFIDGEKYTQEVVKGGSEVRLTEDNKDVYVHNLVMCKLYRETRLQIETIKQELYKMIPGEALQILTPAELSLLMCGESKINPDEIIVTLRTNGMDKDHSLVKWFCEIIKSYDQTKLSYFMFFATGSPRISVGSLKEKPICLSKTGMPETQLPLSHSCFKTIDLPEYSTKEIFAEKLLLAITYGREGFAFR